MRSAVIIIGSKESIDGFRLAGVEALAADDASEATQILESSLSRDDAGVIALEEEWFDALSERMREKIDRLYRPVVLSIPTAVRADQESSERSQRLSSLIKKAVGFEIKLDGAG